MQKNLKHIPKQKSTLEPNRWKEMKKEKKQERNRDTKGTRQEEKQADRLIKRKIFKYIKS